MRHSKTHTPAYAVLVPSNRQDQDGCIWHWQHNPARIVRQPVQVLSGKPRQPRQPLWDDDFLDTADVLEAMHRGSKDEIKRLINQQLADENLAEKVIKDPVAYACAQLASGLAGARFVVWCRDGEPRLEVGVYCDNPRAAAYAALFAHGAEPFPVTRCPECNKRFTRSLRHPEIYCSKRCRNTHNVRESRKRTRRAKR